MYTYAAVLSIFEKSMILSTFDNQSSSKTLFLGMVTVLKHGVQDGKWSTKKERYSDRCRA